MTNGPTPNAKCTSTDEHSSISNSSSDRSGHGGPERESDLPKATQKENAAGWALECWLLYSSPGVLTPPET